MNKKQGLWSVVILVILAILIGGGYLVSKKLQNESVTEEINSEVSGWKTYGEGAIEYPADWTVEENISYAVDGRSITYKGLVLVPPATKATVSADRIFVGAPRVSVCSDVPDATKCRGGGKGSTFTVTFTSSTNPYVLQMYDAILQRWEKHTDWRTYRNEKYGFEFQYPSLWEIDELSLGTNYSVCFNPYPPAGDCKDGLVIVTSIINLPEQLAELKRVYYSFPETNSWQVNNNLYFLAVTKENKSLVNDLVSTFKFTE